jgi:addiction module HigA family antidote
MPRPAIHPGEILADELNELEISPTELSRQISVPPNRISQIIQGKRAITGDTALRLGHWFQTSPQFWLNLQSAYDLRLADDAIGREVAAHQTGKTPRRRISKPPVCASQTGGSLPWFYEGTSPEAGHGHTWCWLAPVAFGPEAD